MHKLFLSLVVIASLGASSAAIAAAPMMVPAKAAAPMAMTTTGKVVAVSTKFCTVALSNRGVFLFGKRCNLSKITVGEAVTITWWKSGALREATKIVAATKADMMKSHMAGMMMMH